MSLNVANCPRCGRIYAKTMKNLCPDCLREEEELYEKVYRFLRDNPKSTVQQVSKATDVPEERILNFLRQDRIMSSEWSQLTYPCETCGADISGGAFVKAAIKKYKNHCNQQPEALNTTSLRQDPVVTILEGAVGQTRVQA